MVAPKSRISGSVWRGVWIADRHLEGRIRRRSSRWLAYLLF